MVCEESSLCFFFAVPIASWLRGTEPSHFGPNQRHIASKRMEVSNMEVNKSMSVVLNKPTMEEDWKGR
ncbi:hypothetical protein NC653_036158 [Populus alba x Populus x berolinensis]|uniref:Uncharacterized protein n=1 Tax=Populus alba x Populus x berolinensis TaxID=444605 RepID=A0AAD6LJ86_9ROSI|nr:hypothetical protein NC653_036158 [Populus alba x Populus x berolinensis]